MNCHRQNQSEQCACLDGICTIDINVGCRTRQRNELHVSASACPCHSMAGTICWRFDDTFFRSSWSSRFHLSDLPGLEKSLHYETTMERPVVIWMRLHDGPAGHETQREQYLGPIPLKDAMAHLLREMVDTEADSLNCTHMCNGRLLAEHGFCMYKPLGRVTGQSSAFVIKNLTSKTFKLQTLILS